jgi:hypothetical protein
VGELASEELVVVMVMAVVVAVVVVVAVCMWVHVEGACVHVCTHVRMIRVRMRARVCMWRACVYVCVCGGGV